MSLNYLYDAFPTVAPVGPIGGPFYFENPTNFIDVSCNNLRANNLNVIDIQAKRINGQDPIPNPPLQENHFLVTDSLGVPEWRVFQNTDINPGPLNNILITDSLGVVRFSDAVLVEELIANDNLVSTNNTTLNDVNILGDIEINSNGGLANQVLGKDNLNVLGWVTLPPTSNNILKSLYYALPNQNLNLFGLTYVQYNLPFYNNLVAEITQTTNQNYLFNVAGAYEVSAELSVFSSASELQMSVVKNGLIQTGCFIGLASNYGKVSFIDTFSPGDLVSIICTRVGLDITPKLVINDVSSGIVFTKLV